jgi:hypothetical protein
MERAGQQAAAAANMTELETSGCASSDAAPSAASEMRTITINQAIDKEVGNESI